MSFYEVVPLIFPGIMIQCLFQFIYIKETISIKNKNTVTKILLSVCIFLLGFPFIAFIHYKNRKDQNIEIHPLNNMTLFFMIIFSFQIFSIQNIFNNLDKTYGSWISVLLGLLYVMLIIFHFCIVRINQYIKWLFALMMIGVAIMVELLIYEFNTQLILINTLSLILLNTPYKKMSLIMFFSLGLLAITNIWKSICVYEVQFNEQTISILVVNLIAAILVFIIFYSFRKQIYLNDRLEEYNHMLIEQQLKIEKLSIEAERYRISHEIHDSVGHHLTAAFITLEKMADNNTDSNLHDLEIVREQVRTGLNQVRAVVHNMNDINHENYEKALQQLFSDSLKGKQVECNIEMDLKRKLPVLYKRFLLNTAKEFITNSLKYGKPKHIDVLMSEQKDYLHIVLTDDGLGVDQLAYGFGLSGIKNTVIMFGGIMKIESALNQGFSMSIQLPFVHERRGEDIND